MRSVTKKQQEELIVTCPSCDTRYNLTDAQLGATGRTIQCVKCHYSWFQPPASLPDHRHTSDMVEKPPLAPENTTAEEIPSIKKQKEHKEKAEMSLPKPVIAGGGLLLIILIALTVSMVITNPFAPKMPAGYRTLTTFEGERLPTVQNGLVLEQIHRKIVPDGDVTVLLFTGKATNTGSAPISVPEIRVQLLDKKGIELDFWPAQIEKSTLKPNESTDWSVRFLDPDLSRIAEYKAFFHTAE